MSAADPGTSGLSGAIALTIGDATNGNSGSLTIETDNVVMSAGSAIF